MLKRFSSPVAKNPDFWRRGGAKERSAVLDGSWKLAAGTEQSGFRPDEVGAD